MAIVLPARLLLAQPVITVQPASQAVLTGGNASFSATVADTEPLTYSWYFNATNPVPSGTNASLTLSNVSAADAGGYTLVASDTVGSVTSVVATLLVALPPSLTLQPSSQSAWPGSNVTFSAAVSGTGPLSYRWFFNGAAVPNYFISTFAGGGPAGSVGDGGPATNAALGAPVGMAFDVLGNLYFADYASNRVRKIDSDGTISTVAGNGVAGYAGDGGPATNASLNAPQAVACDRWGNLLIADFYNNRIRKVDPTGRISTVAGTGTNGVSGDGGAATNASIGTPAALAVDNSGAVYLADSTYYRIRKVATNGIITTVAGKGSREDTGDGGPATNAGLYLSADTLGMTFDGWGNLYFVDKGHYRVRRIDTNGIIAPIAGNIYTGPSPAPLGDGGAVAYGHFLNPNAVALDSLGNLYITDAPRLRRVDPSGVITTLAGTGSYGYSGDGGLATNALLAGPRAVAVDGAGNVFVADTGNRRIRKISCAPSLTASNLTTAKVGGYALTVSSPWGSVTSSVANLTLEGPPLFLTQPVAQAAWPDATATFAVRATGTTPLGYAWSFNGTNLIADASDAQLTLTPVTATNAGSYCVIITNIYGSVTSVPAALTLNQLVAQPTNQTACAGGPLTLSVGVTGPGLFTYQWRCNGTNLPNNVICTVAGNGHADYTGDGGPATNASLDTPYDVTVDAAGNLYIADAYNGRVRKVDTNGVITTVVTNLSLPTGVLLDSSNNLYVADYSGNRVYKLATNGVLSVFAAGLFGPETLAFDTCGNLFIADNNNQQIRERDTTGKLTVVAGLGAYIRGFWGDGDRATQAEFDGPSGVAFDAPGNLYVADYMNNRIRKIDTFGIITTVVGSGPAETYGSYGGDGGPATNAFLCYPSDVAFDSLGNLYIADSFNYRIRKVDTNGIISTVAGMGQHGVLGDGGPATSAQISNPRGLGLDSAGNLYIADTWHNRIRKVWLTGLPTLTLNNLSLTNAGDYSVVISNPSGSITSAVATVTVLLPPTFTGILPQADGTVALSLSGTPNSTNVVWVTSDLTPPVKWLPLATNVAGADGTWQCTDPNPPGSSPRFYRALMP